MKYAIIDIGSNTVRLNLYLITDKHNIVSLLNKKTVAGLSTYINNGNMTKKGADKLVRILKGFLIICQYFNIEHVHMFATAALRNASNSKQILNYVEENVGYCIDLISGEEEAKLGYIGILEDYDVKNGYILDIGGGSVEITVVKDGSIIYATSLTEGHLSMYKKYCKSIVPTTTEAYKIKKHIKKLLKDNKVPKLGESLPIFGVGGTIRACGNIGQEIFDLPSNSVLDKKNLKKLNKMLRNQERTILDTTLQVVPERIHTITPGAIILYETFKHLDASEVLISKRGVRDGYLVDNLENDLEMLNQQLDIDQICKNIN